MSSNRIAELRHKKNMTLKELGNALNMRDNTLSQYENNKREPKVETWRKLADFFNVSVEYLMGLSDSPAPGLSDMAGDITKPLTISYKSLFSMLYITYVHGIDITNNPNFLEINKKIDNLTDYQKRAIIQNFLTWFESEINKSSNID